MSSDAANTVRAVVGFLVLPGQDRCDRCRDVNYDEDTRECLTCADPDDPWTQELLAMRPARDALEAAISGQGGAG